jgi:hypothetical protein
MQWFHTELATCSPSSSLLSFLYSTCIFITLIFVLRVHGSSFRAWIPTLHAASYSSSGMKMGWMPMAGGWVLRPRESLWHKMASSQCGMGRARSRRCLRWAAWTRGARRVGRMATKKSTIRVCTSFPIRCDLSVWLLGRHFLRTEGVY